MENTLLLTKLNPPPLRAKLTPRPQLLAQLDEGQAGQLTLIAAPAGSGKSTLVAAWLQQRSAPAAWLALEEDDNDLARFLGYLIAALQRIESQLGRTIQPLLQAVQLPAIDIVMTHLVNELATMTAELVLALDDYHLITAQPIHDALTFLLNHQPEQLHLVIMTRVDPPLPLARLRGRGQLHELRTADLRFSVQEATTFFHDQMPSSLPPAAITTLTDRTEGWVTGLQLAALSLRSADDLALAVARFTGSHRHVFDYLIDEVLDQQSAPVQRFLLETSILHRLSGALCDAVLDHKGSAAILVALEAANLFLVPLDDERHWYRYHHLFAEVLRKRLHQHLATDSEATATLAELHRRAGTWYEQQANHTDDLALIAEAVRHSLAGADFEQMARLIAHFASPLIWEQGEINMVLQWLEQLPVPVQQQWPQLSLTHALLLAWRQEYAQVEALLQSVVEQLPLQPPAAQDHLHGQVATIRATVAIQQGNAQSAMGFAQEALEFLPADDRQARGISLGILGMIYRAQGEVVAGIRAYRDAADRMIAAGQRVPALIALAYLGQLQIAAGQLKQAEATFQQATQLTERWQAERLPAMGVVRIRWAELLHERNELTKAAEQAQAGIALCEHWDGLGDDIVDGYLTLARIRLAQGDADGVRTALANARRLGQEQHVPAWEPLVSAAEAHVQLRQGDFAAVQQWVGSLMHVNDAAQERRQLTLARYYLASAQYSEAHALLAELRQRASAVGCEGRVLEIDLIGALLYYRQGQVNQALLVLTPALTIAETEGYVRCFVDEGAPMAALLQRAAGQGIAPTYVSRLLKLFDANVDGSPTVRVPSLGSTAASVQPLIEPLTERELEVLQLMAVGRSNPQIATELIIAVTTVKTHVKNIYGKLNVSNRFQAVARAQELKLVKYSVR